MEKKILYHIGLYGFRKLIVYVIIESPNGETHKLEVFRTATGFSVYVDGSNICESITEEDFLQELENPTF